MIWIYPVPFTSGTRALNVYSPGDSGRSKYCRRYAFLFAGAVSRSPLLARATTVPVTVAFHLSMQYPVPAYSVFPCWFTGRRKSPLINRLRPLHPCTASAAPSAPNPTTWPGRPVSLDCAAKAVLSTVSHGSHVYPSSVTSVQTYSVPVSWSIRCWPFVPSVPMSGALFASTVSPPFSSVSTALMRAAMQQCASRLALWLFTASSIAPTVAIPALDTLTSNCSLLVIASTA